MLQLTISTLEEVTFPNECLLSVLLLNFGISKTPRDTSERITDVTAGILMTMHILLPQSD